jgi:Flp pilus assembly protein CpaB
MDDATVLTPPAPPAPRAGVMQGGAQVRPRRSLPGGRAVVGAFLVVIAAVGTFGAYLSATAAPTTAYVVATQPLRVGQTLTELDLADLFTTVAMELPEAQALRAIAAADVTAVLTDTVVVAPVAAGDLVTRSVVTSITTATEGVQLSFSIPSDRAVGGSVRPGERVDVIATFRGSSTDGGETRVVARQVVVVSTGDESSGIEGGRAIITVQVADLATAQLLQHAVDVAEIALVRGASPETSDPQPATTDSRPGSEQQPGPGELLGSGEQLGPGGSDLSASPSPKLLPEPGPEQLPEKAGQP